MLDIFPQRVNELQNRMSCTSTKKNLAHLNRMENFMEAAKSFAVETHSSSQCETRTVSESAPLCHRNQGFSASPCKTDDTENRLQGEYPYLALSA